MGEHCLKCSLWTLLLAGSWQKLQSSNEKPHWIKLDFDHFEVSDSEEEAEQAKAETTDKNKVKKGQDLSWLL